MKAKDVFVFVCVVTALSSAVYTSDSLSADRSYFSKSL